jgi:hypothetical protein
MRHVALSIDGHYLRLADLEGETRVRADGSSLDAATVFERLELAHDRVVLRTLDGKFLACCPDSGLNFGLYPEDELTPRAAFEEVLWPDDQVSLRSLELTFVSADVDRATVTANRVEAGCLERFRYVPVPTALVPALAPAPASSAWRVPVQRSGETDAAPPFLSRFPRQAAPARSEERSPTPG